MNEMKRCVMLGFIFAILMGTSLAENAITGDVKVFQRLRKGWIHYTER
jgi:hypothetical protein